MKREIISNALNSLDTRHISETEVFAPEAMQGSPERGKTMKIKRIAAIALAAALILSLGAAAYAGGLFDLRHMRMEEGRYAQPTVNTAGYAGSVSYKASLEWDDYINEQYQAGKNKYDPDAEDMYAAYHAFSPEAKAALDALLEKYSLKMPEWSETVDGIEGLYSLLGTEGFLPECGEPGDAPVGGWYYQGGSFSLTDTAGTESGKNLSFDMYRYAEGSFMRAAMLIADTNRMDEWTYVCADGTEVHIGLGPTQSIIAAELDNSFVFIYIRSGSENSDPDKHSYVYPTVDRAELESFAESIDFTVLDSIAK